MQNPNITFFGQIIISKVIQFKVISSLFNTEETQILAFSIFPMLFDVI